MLASTAMPTESTKPGDAGQGQGDRDEPEDRVHHERVVDEREAGDEAGQPVVDDHEGDDQCDPDEAREQALGQELAAQRRADLLARQLLDRERQRAELQDGDQVLRVLGREPAKAATADLDLPVRDRLVDDRGGDDGAVQGDREVLADVLGRCSRRRAWPRSSLSTKSTAGRPFRSVPTVADGHLVAAEQRRGHLEIEDLALLGRCLAERHEVEPAGLADQLCAPIRDR